MTASVRVGRLRVEDVRRDPLATRVALDRALAGASFAPRSLPPSAILVVRALRDPLPRRLALDAAWRAPPEWEDAVSRSLDDLARSAARPAFGPVPAGATAVCFADRAELLACLARDWAAGLVGSRWWWRLLVHGEPSASVPAELRAWPAYVPAAFELLAERGEAVAVAAALPPEEAAALAAVVAAAFGTPTVADLERAAGEPPHVPEPGAPPPPSVVAADVRDAGAGTRARPEPMTAAAEIEAAVPEARAPGLLPAQRRLLALALGLRRTPALARAAGVRPFPEPAGAAAAVEASRPAERVPAAPARPEPPPAPSPAAADGEAPPDAVPPQPARSPQRAEAVAAHPESPPESPTPPGEATAPPPPSVPRPPAAARPTGRAPTPREPTESAEPEPRRPAHRPRPSPAREPESPPPMPRARRRARSPHPEAPLPAPPPEPLWLRSFGPAVQTELGGLFYLVNTAIDLGLYGDFTQPARPGIDLDPWDFLALAGRELLGDEDAADDPVWALLAELARRDPEDAPGAGFEPPGGETLGTWTARVAGEVRALLAAADLTPARLVRHAALVHVSDAHVDVVFSLADHPLEIRIAGLDRDPGFVPAAGLHVAFHYE